ncbi:ras and EF-hand domain-containing protein [Syngnathus scovelli]|uniref:ras and EF-hand domain-containing protein n=1 Tax=Syngnathus scovelli TaxID=161590 RepID=UPI002110B826|nr:ras and EF-hand domain-containing protein [Syngnathus scovelli]
MEQSNLRRLFCACDVNQSGKIELDDFTVVCRELNVADSEVQTLFGNFDTDDESSIDFGSFASRFHEVFQVWSVTASPPGMDLAVGFDAECAVSERAEDMNGSRPLELEDDAQQRLAGTEERARAEERKKMEQVLCNVQRKDENQIADLGKDENQIADLGATAERLSQSRAASRLAPSEEEEEPEVSRRVGQLFQENKTLRSLLLRAQSDVGAQCSELDELKKMYADQRAQYQRETNELKKMVIEYESYATQVQILQDLNKQLSDRNASLRTELASEARRKLPAKNEAPAWRTKPISCGSTLSNVSLWADKYLDSGVSLAPDTTESSASDLDQDLDTDDGRGSTETIHRSYSCAHSDPELLDAKSEAGLSLAQSFGSTSSMRKQLSAFAKEQADLDEPDGASPMYHLVLAGDTGAGKSSFLMRLVLNQFRADMQTTLGVDCQIKKMLVDGQKTNLQIWDTAGQERFRSIARSYFRKANGVLLLYDVTSESSFLNIRDWLDQIQNEAEDKVPVCIIGNKVDMREQLPAKRCVSTLEGEKLAMAYGALFFETSAKDGTNVVEAVLHLAREVKKNVKAEKPMPKTSPVDLLATNAKKTFGTCCRL